MKYPSIHRYGAFALLGAAILSASPAYAQSTQASQTAVMNALSAQEKQGLLRMVEEEKLAGDVYQALYERTGLRNFGNIVQSERQHQHAVQDLLQAYRIADPTAGKRVGEFTNPEFTRLYQEWVTQGARSTVDALKVGALIEELDIADLNELAGQTQRADISQVYAHLNRGSRNHLRAFDMRLKRQSGASAYQPQYLSQSEYDAIVYSVPERGGMGGGMRGAGGAGSGRW